MNWKRLLIAALTRKKYSTFIADTKNPGQARRRLWDDEILPLLCQSPYWQSKLENNKQLALDNFPISTYEEYQADLIKAQHSQQQPFNGEELIFWSETSGTAGARKFFPITKSFQQQFQRTMPPFVYNLTRRFSGFFKEKVLYLVAVDSHTQTPAGTPSGWISNFNYKNLPSFLRHFYAIPSELFSDEELYTEWAPLYALATDLSAIFAVTPMVIDVFFERCRGHFNVYLPYLLGTKALPAHLPTLKITKKRRRHLQTLSEPQIKELWPALEFTGCWTSGLCEYPAQELQKLMGPTVALVDGTYSATEGWLTVPMDDMPGGFLHPGAHIVEFIEEGKPIHKDNLLQCWELEVGKQYEVFLTTAMGFVRYQLKDIVRCSGFLNQSPRLVFCYKTQLLKLESCALTSQELQNMLQAVGFSMEPHWFFARNSLGNKVVLVTDNQVQIADSVLAQMHTELMTISETYKHSVGTAQVLPLVLLQRPLAQMLEHVHAQTKPKLVSTEVVVESL